ncbi:MAG: GNAT family N-acetyltransferase, partial [Thermoplasmata archaeon]
MTADASEGVRIARLRDFRGLGALYSRRPVPDRKSFHPFPEGRVVAPLVFLALLTAQRWYGMLGRLNATWGFAFVVHEGDGSGPIDGFVYLRTRRKTGRGFVANIGTLVGTSARGKGVGARLIGALIVEAKRRGVYRIETQAYEWNSAVLRMGEKLGMHEGEVPPDAGRGDVSGAVVTHILDLDESGGAGAREERPTVPEIGPAAGSTAPVHAGLRPGKVSDFRALGALYSSRNRVDRELFHPFPDGRFVAPVVFLVLLTAQRLFGLLVRLFPSAGFLFFVWPGAGARTIRGFAYLRTKRRT